MTIGRAGLFGIETHALTKCSQVVIVFMAKSQRAISCLWHAGRVNQVRWGQKVCQRRCACALPKGKSEVKSTSTMAKMCFLWSIMLLTQLTAKIHTKLHASNGTEIFNFFVFVFFFFCKGKFKDFTFHCWQTFAIGQKRQRKRRRRWSCWGVDFRFSYADRTRNIRCEYWRNKCVKCGDVQMATRSKQL